MKISVVIPALNERAGLPMAVESVRSSIDSPEIIVVDGGSTDGTFEWLRSQSGLRLIESARGKGIQQNAGARIATGEAILFLHADCRLPGDAGKQIVMAISDSQVAGGCFSASWIPSTPALKVIAFGMNLRTALFKRCYGDQAIFVRRRVFDQVGGFPDWPLFEDAELVRRIKVAGRFRPLRAEVGMSSRRFAKTGILRGIFLVYFLQIGFLLGVSPARLKKWFADIRPHPEGGSATKDKTFAPRRH